MSTNPQSPQGSPSEARGSQSHPHPVAEGRQSPGPLTPDLMARIREYAARKEENIPVGGSEHEAYSAGYSDGKRHLSQAILDVLATPSQEEEPK